MLLHKGVSLLSSGGLRSPVPQQRLRVDLNLRTLPREAKLPRV